MPKASRSPALSMNPLVLKQSHGAGMLEGGISGIGVDSRITNSQNKG